MTMKVLIVGPIAGGSVPIAGGIAAAFDRMGYDSNFIDYTLFAEEFRKVRASGNYDWMAAFIRVLEKVLTDQINKTKPDILLGIAQSPLFEPLLDDIRKSGVITTFWFVEDYRIMTYWKRIAPHYDIFFSIQTESFVKALAEAGAYNHYYLPVAFDNNFEEFPVQSIAQTPISFMGAPYPNRVRLFEKLAPFDLKIYGEGWDSFKIPGANAGGRRISESEARSIYRDTKINLNLHSSMHSEVIGGDFVNPRTFELAGLGCFQLTDRRECMPPLYSENEIVQFNDEEELVDLINYYLKNEARRNEIIKNARRRTLRDHLFEHRVVEIMKAVRQL
jgi:spore maturation protein CgeB